MINIESYSFGKFMIDGNEYDHDIKIIDDEIIKWNDHGLSMDDMEDIFDSNPDVIVIGTGASGVVKVKEEIVQKAEKRNIKVEILLTDEACDKFNQLRKKDMKVAAILHSTC